jgi:hypothetical protein
MSIRKTGLFSFLIRCLAPIRAWFGKPSVGDFVGEAVDSGRWGVNCVSPACPIIDERAKALAAHELSDLLAGNDFERTVTPVVRFPQIRFHLHNLFSRLASANGQKGGENLLYCMFSKEHR